MAEDANTRYQRMLESKRHLRDSSKIKDFEAEDTGDYEYTPATEMDSEFIPDNEAGIPGEDYSFIENVVATGYNIPKTVADYALQTLPMAETIINPMGEYSGIYDYFKTLGSTNLENTDFVKIAKNQTNSPDIFNYLEGYKQEYVLNEGRVIDHLNKNLGLDVANLEDLIKKYKGNKEVADSVSSSVKELEQNYLTQDDWYEDEDFYYIKNFKEMPGVNLAWTHLGDLQMPNYGIFKFDDDGQGSMMRTSATNLRGSSIPGVPFIGEQGFGTKPQHQYGLELYGNTAAQTIGELGGAAASLFVGNPRAITHPGLLNKVRGALKGFNPIPKGNVGKAAATGIATIPVAGYFDVLGE